MGKDKKGKPKPNKAKTFFRALGNALKKDKKKGQQRMTAPEPKIEKCLPVVRERKPQTMADRVIALNKQTTTQK